MWICRFYSGHANNRREGRECAVGSGRASASKVKAKAGSRTKVQAKARRCLAHLTPFPIGQCGTQYGTRAQEEKGGGAAKEAGVAKEGGLKFIAL